MKHDNAIQPCPICRSGLERHPQMPLKTQDGEQWHVFICPSENCQSEVWVAVFKGIKKQPWWAMGKR